VAYVDLSQIPLGSLLDAGFTVLPLIAGVPVVDRATPPRHSQLMLTAAVLLLALVMLLLVPWARLELRRRGSRQHRPCAQELWLQDRDQLLYVEAVTEAGVHLLTLDPSRQQLLRWTDSWPVWRERLRVRVVWFTGRTEALTEMLRC
jgi:hypothetical protein